MFRAVKVAGYIRAMEQRGISTQQLLAGTHINPKLVHSTDYTISFEQYRTVVNNMMKLTKNPGIAFSLGDIARAKSLGIFGYAMISSRSLRHALDIWRKYAGSLRGTQMSAEELHDMSSGYIVIFPSQPELGDLYRFEIEETIVQGARLVRDLTGITPVFGKASFTYPEPPHRSMYQRLMKQPLEFQAQQTVVTILKPNLDAPIQTMNEELFTICAEHCQQIMRSLSDIDFLSARLRDLFLKAPSQLPTIDEAASALGLSTRTLSRHMDNLGQTYQSIKDEFRFDLATQYLRSGHMTPKQVSYLLGFSNQSNFSRAFKTWSGQTVGEFIDTENG